MQRQGPCEKRKSVRRIEDNAATVWFESAANGRQARGSRLDADQRVRIGPGAQKITSAISLILSFPTRIALCLHRLSSIGLGAAEGPVLGTSHFLTHPPLSGSDTLMSISAWQISAAPPAQTLRVVAGSEQIKVMWGPRHFVWSHVFAPPALRFRWIRWGAFWHEVVSSSGCAGEGRSAAVPHYDCDKTELLRFACAKNAGEIGSQCGMLHSEVPLGNSAHAAVCGLRSGLVFQLLKFAFFRTYRYLVVAFI